MQLYITIKNKEVLKIKKIKNLVALTFIEIKGNNVNSNFPIVTIV